MSGNQALFPGRQKGPGLKSPNKLWWAKEITPDIHVSGRLTNRQMKYAEDGGFRSLVSLFTYDTEGRYGEDVLSNTTYVKEMLGRVSNLQFAVIMDSDENWISEETIDKLGQILPDIKKPTLIFSDTGLEATFVVLMYLAKESRRSSTFEPKIDSKRFYGITCAMGLDFTSSIYKELVSKITGESVVESPPIPKTELVEWLRYWQAHPVHRNWFTAGQISKPHFPAVESAGFRSVVNIRSGLTYNDIPNQEEVTLLNINENTGTYGKDGCTLLRQSQDRLESTRIDRDKSNQYISNESLTNYESRNEDEFGDDIGYNRDLETKYFQNYPKIDYITLPVVSAAPFTKEVYYKYREQLLEVGKKGAVLVHCAKARRASFLTILAAAEQHGKDLKWALKRSEELGYAVSKEKNPVVYETFVGVLGTKS